MSDSTFFIKSFLMAFLSIYQNHKADSRYRFHSGMEAYETWIETSDLSDKEIAQWKEMLKSIHLEHYQLDENALTLIDSKTPTYKKPYNIHEEFLKMAKIAQYKKKFGLETELDRMILDESLDQTFIERLYLLMEDLYTAVNRSMPELIRLFTAYEDFIDSNLSTIRYLLEKPSQETVY